jgi:hypothetical protein
MGGWLRQIVLNAQLRAGLSGDVAIWAALAATALPIALLFFLIAVFVWLSDLYTPVVAGVVLGAAFALLGAGAGVVCVVVRRRNIERARTELEMRKSANANLFDPKLIAMGYQIGQAVGWRKLVSLAAVALVAAGLAREWLGRSQPENQDSPDA